ncbi:MAG: TlpA family protein disulfide reductase [Fimbriimonadaceae bacterium]|nr:MAG: TlpA family protein disulfide reductase [Fimbriimonadaceae bacterium]
MLTATLVFLTATQGSPVERFTSFIEKSTQLTMATKVRLNNATYETKLIWDQGTYQYFEVKGVGVAERFWQVPNHILAANDSERQYWEYSGFEKRFPPPPEVGFCSLLFPVFLEHLSTKNGLQDLKAAAKITVSNRAYESVTKTFKDDFSQFNIQIAIDEFGIPVRFIFKQKLEDEDVEMTYDVLSLNTNPTELKRWKYQPPLGYMPGQIPYKASPLGAGYQAKLGTWKKGTGGSLNVSDLNKKGLVVLFTASDCEPSKKAAGTLDKLGKALDQQGVKIVEIRLGNDASQLKRNWSVISDADGKIEKQFQPPVTPYLYAIDSKSIVLGAWAGYGADQERTLISSVVGRFKKDSGE